MKEKDYVMNYIEFLEKNKEGIIKEYPELKKFVARTYSLWKEVMQDFFDYRNRLHSENPKAYQELPNIADCFSAIINIRKAGKGEYPEWYSKELEDLCIKNDILVNCDRELPVFNFRLLDDFKVYANNLKDKELIDIVQDLEKNHKRTFVREDLEVRVILEKERPLSGKTYANIVLGQDIVLKNVEIKETETEKGKSINFQIPTIKTYEKDGKKIYIHSADISSTNENTKKEVIRAIREATLEAINSENGVGESIAKEVYQKEIEGFNKIDMVKAYVKPLKPEYNENYKAGATVYLGDIVKLNNVSYREYTNSKEETKDMISFPSRKYEKDGEENFDDQIILLSGLRSKVKDAIVSQYISEIERANEAEAESQEEDYEEEM